MNNQCKWSVLSIVGLLAATLMSGGCDDPSTSELDNYFENNPIVNDPRTTTTRVVSISPSSASISTVGSRIVFRASGGKGGYTWNVSNKTVGNVTASGNAQAVYTARQVADNDVIVYDGSGNAAIAYISIGDSAELDMTITAKPATISTNGNLSVLSVSGGFPPYDWTVSYPLRGDFPSGSRGASVVYRRLTAGENAVTVTDANDNSARLILSQPMSAE